MFKKIHIFLTVGIALIGLLKFCDIKKDKEVTTKITKDSLLYLNHKTIIQINVCLL